MLALERMFLGETSKPFSSGIMEDDATCTKFSYELICDAIVV